MLFFFGGGRSRVWPVNAMCVSLSVSRCVCVVCVRVHVCVFGTHACTESIFEQHLLTYTNMLHELRLIYTQAYTQI